MSDWQRIALNVARTDDGVEVSLMAAGITSEDAALLVARVAEASFASSPECDVPRGRSLCSASGPEARPNAPSRPASGAMTGA